MGRNTATVLDTALDLEATLTIGPEEHQRLLASAFALQNEHPRPSTDDEITVDAPAPVALVARITQRPPVMKMVFTSAPPPRHTAPPPAVIEAPTPPPSGFRLRITPERAKAAHEDAGRKALPVPARTAVASLSLMMKRNPQLVVVAGIWAMALSLVAMLALIVTA